MTSDRSFRTPFAPRLRVLEELPFREKQLKAALRERGIGRLTIKKRGVDVVPDELRKRLALRGDKEGTLVLTRVQDKATALLVEPLRESDPRRAAARRRARATRPDRPLGRPGGLLQRAVHDPARRQRHQRRAALDRRRHRRGPSELQWVVSGYTLAFGLVPVLAGRLGDDHGRRRMFQIGVAGFARDQRPRRARARPPAC